MRILFHRVRVGNPGAALVLPLLLLAACVAGDVADAPESAYGEPNRPQFHFSPPDGWMNDPNGLVYADGEYHLFYQFYPDSTVWGPMHWGHAVSRDLVHWEHLPIALAPDSLGYIFSGSAVVDWNNSTGFRAGETPPLVAIFTQHDPGGADAGRTDYQSQGIAFSNDRGRSWTMYAGNPVLPNPGVRDFRDPKVRWYQATAQWIMALAAGDHIRFYGSPDLRQWRELSRFGESAGAHGGVWECPDLFPLTAPDGRTRWVLLVSINPGAPNGGNGTQYFIGDFDGTTFTSENPPATERWLDWGRDNYAGSTWSDVPPSDGRRLFIGWNSNWDYGQQVPTAPWRSAMTLPRTLSLIDTDEGLRVASRPIDELRQLRGTPVTVAAGTMDSVLTVEGLADASRVEAIVAFGLDASARAIGFELANANGERYRFGFDRASGQVYSDRRHARSTPFSDRFARDRDVAPYHAAGPDLRLHIFVDRSSVEVFVDDGQLVMSELLFPTAPFDRVRLFAEDGSTVLRSAEFYPLATIWSQ